MSQFLVAALEMFKVFLMISTPARSCADAATWEGIEITFLSDERVQIHIGKTHETRNYAEFGFQDNKSKNPNRA